MTDSAVSPLPVRSRSAGAWRSPLVAAAIAFATATHANAARAQTDATGEAEAASDAEAEQTQTGATVLPAVRVEAEAKDPAVTEGSGSYATPSTRTATGLSLSPQDTPQSVSVITRERIDDQQMKTVAEALRNTTGVSLKATDRGRNALSVRGFDVSNFQIDGLPVVTGNVGIETASTAIYDRIEIVRGATGLLNGAGDPSATVNLVRKRADSSVLNGSLSYELGSWDRFALTADVSTPLTSSGAVRGRIVGSLSRQDAFIDLEQSENSTFYAIVEADLGERTLLSVGASDERDQLQGVYWGGLPYWFSDGTRTDWNRSTTTATNWNRWDTTEQTLFAALDHRFENGWTLRARANHYRQDELSNLLWVTGEPDRETGEGMQADPYLYVTERRQNQFSAMLSGPFSLFGREHELSAGLLYSRLKDGWDNGGVPLNADESSGPIGNFYDWDGSFPAPVWDVPEIASRGTTTQAAVYAAARLQLNDAMKLIAGGRLSRYEQDNEQAVWTPEPYTLRENAVFTPYAGLLYDIGERLTAYASYTTIFKPQDERDRNGRYLDPLEGNSYELGLKGAFLDDQLNASVALFRIDQDNFAVDDVGFVVPGTTNTASRAADGTEADGYELEVVGQLTPNWDLSLGWTSFSARDADGADVAVIHPRRMLKLFTKVELSERLAGLSLGAGVDWQSDVPERRPNPATDVLEPVGQQSFALVELMARYQISEPWSVQANLYNVLDEKYYEGSWGTFTYGEPRQLLVSLDYRF